MARSVTITPAMFRDWVVNADEDDLEEFIDAITEEIELLEQDDFFGTEGFNKRFA